MDKLMIPQLCKKIIFNKYKVLKFLNRGSKSFIFEGINIKTKTPVAMKFEPYNNFNNELEKECNFLMSLQGYGIPKIISYGRTFSYNVLIQELLGPNFITILKSQKKLFSLKDTCMIAIQTIERLKYIHEKNIIYQNINPKNFAIGNSDKSIIYLLDFKQCTKYKSSRTGKHILLKKNKFFNKNWIYNSINSTLGYNQSRKDDLESVCYMLIILHTGKLPWVNNEIRKSNNEKIIQTVAKIKKITAVENICKGCSKEFVDYLKYIRNLKFEENPDYEYLINLFVKILDNMQQNYDLKFSWINEKNHQINLNKNYQIHNLSRRKKNSPMNRMYNKIKKSMEEKNKRFFNTEAKNDRIISLNINLLNTNINPISCERYFSNDTTKGLDMDLNSASIIDKNNNIGKKKYLLYKKKVIRPLKSFQILKKVSLSPIKTLDEFDFKYDKNILKMIVTQAENDEHSTNKKKYIQNNTSIFEIPKINKISFKRKKLNIPEIEDCKNLTKFNPFLLFEKNKILLRSNSPRPDFGHHLKKNLIGGNINQYNSYSHNNYFSFYNNFDKTNNDNISNIKKNADNLNNISSIKKYKSIKHSLREQISGVPLK